MNKKEIKSEKNKMKSEQFIKSLSELFDILYRDINKNQIMNDYARDLLTDNGFMKAFFEEYFTIEVRKAHSFRCGMDSTVLK